MKVLVSDLLFQHGNRHVDSVMMDGLAENNEVFVLREEADYPFEMKNRNKVTFVCNKYAKNSNNAIKYKIQVLQRIFLSAKKAKEIDADVIIFSTYDTRVMPFGLWSIGKRKIVVIENDNIDLLKSRVHRICYKMFSKKVHHMVYEKFFGDYLHSTHDVPNEMIHHIPHVVYANSENAKSNYTDGVRVNCIAISNSNDENFVKRIIEFEKDNAFFKKNKIRCRVKSKIYDFTDEYLVVNNSFIPVEEYERLYSECEVVLVPFPNEYKYRMSGCITDAFSHRKKVIATNFELARVYSIQYGSIIDVYEDVEDFAMAIQAACIHSDNEKLDFSVYEEEHSKKYIQFRMESMLESL